MPVHDWSLVEAGIFHDFHTSWIGILRSSLDEGGLPSDFYALAEQSAGDIGPDVLTLHAEKPNDHQPLRGRDDDGGLAVAERPPRVRFLMPLPQGYYAAKRRRLVIRRVSKHRIVAVIEIVSPGNKTSRDALKTFIDKVVEGLRQGIHFPVVDLHGPTARDPEGVHGEIFSALGDGSFEAPDDKPLTLASYSAKRLSQAYIEPIAVDDSLGVMPLFLTDERYVEVPLETTYNEAFRGVPRVWKQVLEQPPPARKNRSRRKG